MERYFTYLVAALVISLQVATFQRAQALPFSPDGTTRESVKVVSLDSPPQVEQLTADSGGLRFQKTEQGNTFLVFWSKDATIDDLNYCQGFGSCDVNRCTTSGRMHVYWVDKASGKPAVCVSYTGIAEGDGHSFNPWVGGPADGLDEGRYVVFESEASNLIGAATEQQIIVHDRKWERTWLSKSKECAAPDSESFINMVTDDGQKILLASDAEQMIDNLNPKCTDGGGIRDIFVRDGASCKTPGLGECVTNVLYDDYGLHAGANTVSLLDGHADNAHMIQDGSVIVFETVSTVPVRFLPDTLGKKDIFMHQNGTFSMLSQRAVAFTGGSSGALEFVNIGGPANDDSTNAQISESGRYVVFDSYATDLVMEQMGSGLYRYKPTGDKRQIYLLDRSTTTMKMISTAPNGTPGNNHSQRPYISNNGSYIIFESEATNLIPGLGTTTAKRNIFFYHVATGVTVLVTPGTTGYGINADASITDFSPDGMYVAFESAASDVISGITNSVQDVFLATYTDTCPSDADKFEPGQCGCGNADTDTDSDGTADCNDKCKDDPAKTTPGTCGCGVSDADANGNGNADCLDPQAGSTPKAPRIKVTVKSATRATALITATSRYPNANVSYEFDFGTTRLARRYNRVITRALASNSNKIRIKVKPGKSYRVRYRVIAGSDVTEYSRYRKFRVSAR